MLGIVSVRGHIVSLLDLRVLFDLPLGGLSDKNFVAILRSTEMEFGLLLDRVRNGADTPRCGPGKTGQSRRRSRQLPARGHHGATHGAGWRADAE
ncbi:chemotaxis protein CheW [Pseudomonas lalucatii]|nr:chemotaxis protein CheW [Pseudomonas lalucatii]